MFCAKDGQGGVVTSRVILPVVHFAQYRDSFLQMDEYVYRPLWRELRRCLGRAMETGSRMSLLGARGPSE